MNPRAYHWGEWQRLESAEDPWLDDNTTVPYRESRHLTQRADAAPRPRVRHGFRPTIPRTTTSDLDRSFQLRAATASSADQLKSIAPGTSPRLSAPPPAPRIRGAQLSAASPTPMAAGLPHPPLPPLPTAALLVDSAGKYRNKQPAAAGGTASVGPRASMVSPRPTHTPKQNVLPVGAATASHRASPRSHREQPESSATLKRGRVAPHETRAFMTHAQLSQAALEEFWRQEHERVARAHRLNRLWMRAAAALLCVFLGVAIYRSGLIKRFLERSVVGSISNQLLHDRPNMKRMQAPVAGVSGVEASNAGQTQPDSDDAALTQPATLRIDSKPIAQVFVDGVRIGNTPQLAITLRPGEHSLQLYNADRVLLKDITLSVQPGETISRVEYLDR